MPSFRPAGGSGGSGAINVPSDQIFDSTAERDSFFSSNPTKLFDGAQCVVLTNPPEGLYQVYTSGAWQDRTAVVVGPRGKDGPKGDIGDAVEVGDGSGDFKQVSKIDFDTGLSIDVVGDTATVIVENPALISVKSVDGIEPDEDGNVKIDALRGRINVTSVDSVDINPGDGVTIEGVLAGGGFTIYKHTQQTSLDGICVDKVITAGGDGIIAIDGVFSAVEMGVDAPFAGAKIVYDLQNLKAKTINFIKDKEFILGDVVDNSGEVRIDAKTINAQIQADFNAKGDLEAYINVVNPEEGKYYDGKYVFKNDEEKARGYEPAFSSPIYVEYPDLGVKVYKPLNGANTIINGLSYGFKYESPPYYQDFYLVITDERLKEIQLSGNDIGYAEGKTEYGLALGSDAKVALAFSTLSVTNPDYGSKINHAGYWIPNISPSDGSIIDPNDDSNTHFLTQDGDLTDSSGAYFNGYSREPFIQVEEFRGQKFGYSLKRGFLYQDPANSSNVQFIASDKSDYFVIPAGRHTLGISGDTEMALHVSWGKTKIFSSGINAAIHANEHKEVQNYRNVDTYSHEGDQYVSVDKTYPAECVGQVNVGHIVQMVASLTINGVPAIKEVSTSTIISGIAMADGDDTDVINVLEKGTYDNEIVRVIPQDATAGDIVYVNGDTGFVTLDEGEENTPIGYVMESKNVYIDNDLYNAKFSKQTPKTESVDVAFWWTANAEPVEEDILNALGQVQTDEISSHRDGIKKDDLSTKTFTALRDEDSFKYLFFAWPADFFDPEPTKIDTGFGSPSTWIPSTVSAGGVVYNVLTVEVRNDGKDAEDYGLVQEGSR